MRDPLAPSGFYRGWLWRLGLALVRYLPLGFLQAVGVGLAGVYCRARRARREVVIRNLLPAVANDPVVAGKIARRLFRQFAIKLTELWRFEAGIATDNWVVAGADWALLEAICARGKGVLLLTPHLGNWELGGALLARRGIKLVVLTQSEPGSGFTELRKASRSRWGIETFVIGSNGFEFIEIIKRLQDGAVVALLIDRPSAAKAVRVELFGQSFPASIAAAELARASGCALVGVTIVRSGDAYCAKILPEFHYDRQALGHREARERLTQEILRAFEPEIKEHLDQWYHFVPIWPEART